MNKDNKKQAYKFATQMFECSKYYPDVITYLVALMKDYNCLEQVLKDIKEYTEKTSTIMKYNNQPLNMCNSNGILDIINKELGDDKQ